MTATQAIMQPSPDQPDVMTDTWLDPRRTQTARSADLPLALKPGTNRALMNGLVQQIIANNWTDSAYINAHTRNYDEMAALVKKYNPEYVSNITGCPADDIALAAKWIGESPEALSLFIQGVPSA